MDTKRRLIYPVLVGAFTAAVLAGCSMGNRDGQQGQDGQGGMTGDDQQSTMPTDQEPGTAVSPTPGMYDQESGMSGSGQ